jgi:hypothetical protein
MYSRRILHHGPDPAATPVEISDRAIAGCWFELHRQGGCGAGELALKDRFPERDAIEIGDWISFEYEPDARWYLGRVEERAAECPARVRLRLEGMGIELNEVFPGGFGEDAEGVPPHRYGVTDVFSYDPDYSLETVDIASFADDLVSLLLEQYVTPATHIAHDPVLVEPVPDPAVIQSFKFRGEESVRTILKQTALMARGASWGVDAEGTFFFLQRRDDVLVTLREGRDQTALSESRDRELLFNRVLLTGDYIYDPLDSSGHLAQREYRFRGNYVQPESREAHGERRIRLWIPWLRAAEDALAFVREFFREYAQPTSRYLLETDGRATLLLPWAGRVRLEDRDGGEIITGQVETVRVSFDHVPRFRMELGPEDPRTLWPEPPQDERWELGRQRGGGPVSVTESLTSSGDGSSSSGASDTSDESEESEGSSQGSSGATSSAGSDGSSDDSSDASSTASTDTSGSDDSSDSSDAGSSGASSDASSDSSGEPESNSGPFTSSDDSSSMGVSSSDESSEGSEESE